MLGNFSCFLLSSDFFPKLMFLENSFKNTTRGSNSLDPDQVRHFVGPDLGSRLFAKVKSSRH